MRALLDANPDLIVRLTRDGTYLDVHATDPRVNYHLPLTMHDFIGRNVADLFEPEFAREHARYRNLALATGQMQRWEYVRKDPRGSPRHIEARFVKSGDDEVVATVRDFTERVELEREVIASGERERTRIGQDLHDGLAQLLIGVRLLLTALRDKLTLSGSPHHDDADRAVDLVSRAIAQTSELAHGLSPIPKRGRLSDALRQLGKESEKLLGVRCDVDCQCAGTQPTLSETTATHLYRIAQEAITNAVKHGKATRIDIKCAIAQGDPRAHRRGRRYRDPSRRNGRRRARVAHHELSRARRRRRSQRRRLPRRRDARAVPSPAVAHAAHQRARVEPQRVTQRMRSGRL